MLNFYGSFFTLIIVSDNYWDVSTDQYRRIINLYDSYLCNYALNLK